MRQFLLDQAVEPGGRITLEGSEYRYLVQVLRLKAGDSVEARLPGGELVTLSVERVDARAKACRLIRPRAAVSGSDIESVTAAPGRPTTEPASGSAGAGMQPESPSSMPPLPAMPADFPRIVLFQWILKGPKMDQVIRQATETGVSAIVPVLGARCVARDDGDASARAGRWARIVREARQQSGSPIATVVTAPVAVAGIASVWGDIATAGNARALVLTEAPLARKTLHEYLDMNVGIVALATGPEGGMTGEELVELERAGFSAVHFRTNILRAETAALYGIAAAQSAITESEKWQLKE